MAFPPGRSGSNVGNVRHDQSLLKHGRSRANTLCSQENVDAGVHCLNLEGVDSFLQDCEGAGFSVEKNAR